MKQTYATPWFWIPALAVVLAVGVLPLAIAMAISFTDLNFNLPNHEGKFVAFDNYRTVLSDSRFWDSILRTVLYATICIPCEALLGVSVAVVISRSGRMTNLLATMLALPTLLAPVTVGLAWRLLLHGDYGPIGYQYTALSGHSLLGTPLTAFVAVCCIDIWQWTPFFAMLTTLGLNAVPESLKTAAQIDGASESQFLSKVSLPIAGPVVLLGIIVRVLDAFKDYDKVHGLTSGGPASSTELCSTYMATVAYSHGEIGTSMAMGTCVFATSLAIVHLALLLTRRLLH
jgi:multiple sugar transport system permease protein